MLSANNNIFISLLPPWFLFIIIVIAAAIIITLYSIGQDSIIVLPEKKINVQKPMAFSDPILNDTCWWTSMLFKME